MAKPQVFTIGYEGADVDRFLTTLKDAGVATLADVRAVALSRKRGFSKSALRDALAHQGIGYEHFIKLGTPKEGRQAARAGAQELDVAQARVGTFTLDPAAADAAARAYLADAGVSAKSVRVSGDQVEVTVELRQPTPLLSILGIDERTVTATASARSARGVIGVASLPPASSHPA